MADRTRARELATQFIANGDPTGWFEQLYKEAEQGQANVSWADLRPNPSLIEFWTHHSFAAAGKSALKVGCGFGDDAEQLAQWVFAATAFDISPSAIRECKRRFPKSSVNYAVADVLHPPAEWSRCFGFVLEAYTLQVLPPELRPPAIGHIADFVGPGGTLVVVARAREAHQPEGLMPWPLMRSEIDQFKNHDLREVTFEDFSDDEDPPVRRFRTVYKRD
jgi:SAM-dependent methyltransferase